jgi:hypothetical protein
MAWVTPIRDRTLDDVNDLKVILAIIAELGWASTPTETKTAFNTDHKGAWNFSDVNRINGNNNYLRDLLTTYGYTVTFSNEPTSHVATIPTFIMVNRMIKVNLNACLLAFPTFTYPTLKVAPKFTLEDANAYEETQYLLYSLLQNMISEFIICGTYISGEDVSL